MFETINFAPAEFVFTPVRSRTTVRLTDAFPPKEGQLDAVQSFAADGRVEWMQGYIGMLKDTIRRVPFHA